MRGRVWLRLARCLRTIERGEADGAVRGQASTPGHFLGKKIARRLAVRRVRRFSVTSQVNRASVQIANSCGLRVTQSRLKVSQLSRRLIP